MSSQEIVSKPLRCRVLGIGCDLTQIIRRFRQKYGLRFTPREDAACRRLARAYLIDGRYQRIYHYHIRKSGGTSINQMFLAASGRPGSELYVDLSRAANGRLIVGDKVFVGWNRRLIEQGHYYFAFSHLPAHQVTLPADTFTLTCIRDPLQRLISHYSMLREYQAQGSRRVDLQEEMSWLGGSFSDFVRSMPRTHLQRQLYMFSSRFDVAEALDNILACSFLFFTRTMAGDVQALSRQLDLDLLPLHSRRSSRSEVIAADGLALAREALEPELRLVAALEEQRTAVDEGQV